MTTGEQMVDVVEFGPLPEDVDWIDCAVCDRGGVAGEDGWLWVERRVEFPPGSGVAAVSIDDFYCPGCTPGVWLPEEAAT